MNRALQFAPFVIVAIMFGVFIWGTDYITLQGEWTIYTVECTQGVWNGDICTGKAGGVESLQISCIETTQRSVVLDRWLHRTVWPPCAMRNPE